MPASTLTHPVDFPAPVTMASNDALVTIPHIKILSIGMWRAATGIFTVTEEILASCQAAASDPAVPGVRLKLGHYDILNDAVPAFGRIENLSIEDNGQTLYGDIVGVPAWLAKIMPVAYPSRSIEGDHDLMTSTGNKYPFALSALSVGNWSPACESLEDLEILFTKEGPAKMPKLSASVNANVAVDDIRRAWLDSRNPMQSYWWVRSLYVDPQVIIVDDDEHLYSITYTIDGDSVTFGDPKQVVIEYVPVSVAASKGDDPHIPAATWATREESTIPPQENNVPEINVREMLGLAEDSTDDDVKAALTELVAKNLAKDNKDPKTELDVDAPPAPADPPPPVSISLPEGVVAIDKPTFDELKVAAMRGQQAYERQAKADRETVLTQGVKLGKFTPARLDHWGKLYDADPVGTTELIGSLAEGLVPVEEIGVTGDSVTLSGGETEYYPKEWLANGAAIQSPGAVPNSRVTMGV